MRKKTWLRLRFQTQQQQRTYGLEFGSLKYQGRLNTFCGGLVQTVCQPKQIWSKGKSCRTRFVIGVDGAKKLQCMHYGAVRRSSLSGAMISVG